MIVRPMPDVEIDVTGSRVLFAGTAFPAALPNTSDEPEDELPWGGLVSAYLGTTPPPIPAYELWVPLENGALVEAAFGPKFGVSLTLYLPWCVPCLLDDHPEDLVIACASLVPYRGGQAILPDRILSMRILPTRGDFHWSRCAPWWAAEHLTRLSTFHVPPRPPDIPNARLRPLSAGSWAKP